MFKSHLRLGRILGISLHIDLSWVFVLSWLTWSLARIYYPRAYPYWTGHTYWALAALTAVGFSFSILAHELGHALVARLQGQSVKGISLFIFGGVTEVPDDPQSPRRELVQACAGPLVSLGLGGLFLAETRIPGEHHAVIDSLCQFLATINLGVAAFNLLPGFPLDGGRVLRAFLWKMRHDLLWATRWATHVGRSLAYGLVIVGMWRALTGYWVNGLWVALIGLYLDSAARSSYRRLRIKQLLEAHVAREVMSQTWQIVPPQLTLDLFVQGYLLKRTKRAYLVGHPKKIEGIVSLTRLERIPRRRWATAQVRDITIPLEAGYSVSPEMPLDLVLEQMMRLEARHLPVIDQGSLIGVICQENLVWFVRHHTG